MINTIIWGNTAANGPSIFEESSTLVVRYSDVEGDDDWPGEGNENIDPGFGDDGYHLSDTSPIWNGGITATVINGMTYECPEYDIDGEPRPWENTDPEIGADETPSSFVSNEESVVGSLRSAGWSYPNPIGIVTTFEYELQEAGVATLTIFNITGQEVAILVNEKQSIGMHEVMWNAEGLPMGIYFYKLTVGSQRSTISGKMIKH